MLQNYLPSQIDKLRASRENNSELRILSIGSGTGEMDMKIVDMIAEELKRKKENQNMKIYVRAIEPNAASCLQFNEAVGKLNNLQVKFDVRPETFGQYIVRAEDASFDIIHFIHSIYFIDSESAILYCLEKQMKADGCLICVFSDHGIIADVQNQITIAQKGELAELHGDSKTSRLINSIEKVGWKYEIIRHEYPVDVTDIIDSSGSAEDGYLLLDFLTNQADFRRNAEANLVENVLEMLRNRSTIQNGRRISSKTDTLLIIHK